MPVKAVIFDAFGTLLRIQDGRHPYRQLLTIGRANGRRPRPDDASVLMESRKRLANSPCVSVSQAARVALSHAERPPCITS
ncbi:hypothetical protein Pstu14405_21390 [Stutzerimonas stutzeri]|nr:hypothetical protein Pstu14405_21390 [Stutzerimonas stutzeri]